MKQFAEHGKVGICHALRNDEMYKRVFSGGYPYIKNGMVVRSSSALPIYSYGKNYERDDEKFALFVWTTEDSQSEIEQMFDVYSGVVTSEQIAEVADNGSFVYID